MTTTASASLPPECETDCSRRLPSLAISEHSTVKGTPQAIRDWLTSFQRDSRASRIQVPLEAGTVPTKCGAKQASLFGRSGQGSSSWRTSSDALSTGPQPASEIWAISVERPRFRRRTWAQTTHGSDIGLLHTPTTKANYSCASMQKWPCSRNFVRVFGAPTPESHEWLMGWPIGWSALSPLETDRFQSWLQRHSGN